MVNEALFAGVRNAMMEEKYKIPTNSGSAMELMRKETKV